MGGIFHAKRIQFNKDLLLCKPFHELGFGFIKFDVTNGAFSKEGATNNKVLLHGGSMQGHQNQKEIFKFLFSGRELIGSEHELLFGSRINNDYRRFRFKHLTKNECMLVIV